MTYRSHAVVCVLLLCSSCSAESAPYEELAVSESPLMGQLSVESSCDETLWPFIRRATAALRAGVPTPAFRETLLEFMLNGNPEKRYGTAPAGPYKWCDVDPLAGVGLSITQFTAVLTDVANAPNDVEITCGPGSNNASAHPGDDLYFEEAEEFRWTAYFDEKGTKRGILWGMAEDDNYGRAASIELHEILHQHGFSHGANEQPEAIVACGQEADPDWHYQDNTTPYIAEAALKYTLNRGRKECRSELTCPIWSFPMTEGLTNDACYCAYDRGSADFIAAHAAVNL